MAVLTKPLQSDPALQLLLKEAQEREAYIAKIKAEVSQERDNEEDISLFQQLQPAV